MRCKEYSHNINLDSYYSLCSDDTLLVYFIGLFPTIWWHIRNMPGEGVFSCSIWEIGLLRCFFSTQFSYLSLKNT